MAQASGITNTIRQIGGSLGVAILATLLTTRVAYHTQLYGESIQPKSEVFQRTVGNLKTSIQYNAGTSPANAVKLSQTAILTNLTKQAYVQGINDDFLFAGIITLIGGIPIFFSSFKKTKK